MGGPPGKSSGLGARLPAVSSASQQIFRGRDKKCLGLCAGSSPTLAPSQFTLPAMFRKAGYATGLVGKWHLGLGDGVKTMDWNGTG